MSIVLDVAACHKMDGDTRKRAISQCLLCHSGPTVTEWSMTRKNGAFHVSPFVSLKGSDAGDTSGITPPRSIGREGMPSWRHPIASVQDQSYTVPLGNGVFQSACPPQRPLRGFFPRRGIRHCV